MTWFAFEAIQVLNSNTPLTHTVGFKVSVSKLFLHTLNNARYKLRFKFFKSQTCHFGNPKQRTELACSESRRSLPSDIQDARMNWRRQCFRISAFPKFQKRNGFFNIYLRKFQVCQSSSLWNRVSRYDMVCIWSNSGSQFQHTVDTYCRLQSFSVETVFAHTKQCKIQVAI